MGWCGARRVRSFAAAAAAGGSVVGRLWTIAARLLGDAFRGETAQHAEPPADAPQPMVPPPPAEEEAALAVPKRPAVPRRPGAAALEVWATTGPTPQAF